MGVDHGVFYIAMAESFLNRTDVGSLFQKVRGERMAEGVAGRRFADPRCLHGCTHGALHKARIEMVPSLDVLSWIPPASGLGKQPLPAPFPGRIPVFPLQGAHPSSVARWLRKALISASPMVRGWRIR